MPVLPQVNGDETSMTALKEEVRRLGWIVDDGDAVATRTHPYTKGEATYGSRAVQFHPHGGQSDFVWLSARTPHGAYVW